MTKPAISEPADALEAIVDMIADVRIALAEFVVVTGPETNARRLQKQAPHLMKLVEEIFPDNVPRPGVHTT